MPNLLAGSIIGVLTLALLPAWIVLLAVSAIMTNNTFKTSNRYMKVKKKVGRLWEAQEAPPQNIPIESKIKKFGGRPPVPPIASLIYAVS